MTDTPQRIDALEFFAVARRNSLISSEVADVLAEEIASSGRDPAQYVLEQGIMDSVAVDIVETLLHPRDIAEGYEVESLKGRGGLGVVYRARQIALDRPVALKTILVSQMAQPGSVARFEQEARLVGKLRHPNIVVAIDFGRRHGRVYLVMEFVDGEDLESLIERRGAVDEATTWSIIRQAAAGLSHAAQSGVVHRDIKPANLLLVSPPAGSPLRLGRHMVKIADFGLARLSDPGDLRPRITTDGCTLGSPQYMAPEQIGGADVDHRADIYALGATAFHMLAGAPAFAGLALGEILTRKLGQGMPKLDADFLGLSSETVELIEAMTRTDMIRRVADYDQLLACIDRLPEFEPASPNAGVRPIRGGGDTATVALTETVPVIEPPGSVGAAPVKARVFGRKWLFAVGLPVVLLTVLGAWAIYYWTNQVTADVDGPRFVPSGRVAALFDGRQISDWRITSGAWFADRDAEGGRVLSGQGTVRRRLPSLETGGGPDEAPPHNYQLDVAFDLRQASAVELHFGIAAAPPGNQTRYVLRVTRDAAVLGRRDGDHEPLEQLSAALSFAPRGADDSVPEYHLLRVERHGTFWRVSFDRRPLGGVPVLDRAEWAEFRLVTQGGPVLFDALSLLELVPPGR